MKSVPRHAIDPALAKEGAERYNRLLSSTLKSAASRAPALSILLRTARGYAGYLGAVPLEIGPLCSALRTGARGAVALFALATGSGEMQVDLGASPLQLPATGPTDATHPGNWRIGWWMAQIVCDRHAIDRLGAIPMDVLRRSSSRADACQYLFVEALQAVEKRATDWGARLQLALDATDPQKVALSDEEFVLNILVPEMELLYRLATGDVASFNETLQFALDRHKKYWSKASRKRDPDGYIALGPLAIAGIARKAGIPIEVESEYLPIPLLEGRCCK